MGGYFKFFIIFCLTLVSNLSFPQTKKVAKLSFHEINRTKFLNILLKSLLADSILILRCTQF